MRAHTGASVLFACGNSLIGCYGNHFINIVNRASATQVVNRAGNALKNGSDSLGIAETLHKFV